MDCNTGTTERVIRIVLGTALISVVFMGPKIKLGYVGVIPLITGITGYCPGYAMAGVSTA